MQRFREAFYRSSDYKRMEANDPWDMTNIVSRDIVGLIYEGRHYILLNINYLNCGPHLVVSYFHSMFIE